MAKILWTWAVLSSGEVGVCAVADLDSKGEGNFAIFKDMNEAAGYVLDHGGTFRLD